MCGLEDVGSHPKIGSSQQEAIEVERSLTAEDSSGNNEKILSLEVGIEALNACVPHSVPALSMSIFLVSATRFDPYTEHHQPLGWDAWEGTPFDRTQFFHLLCLLPFVSLPSERVRESAQLSFDNFVLRQPNSHSIPPPRK